MYRYYRSQPNEWPFKSSECLEPAGSHANWVVYPKSKTWPTLKNNKNHLIFDTNFDIQLHVKNEMICALEKVEGIDYAHFFWE